MLNHSSSLWFFFWAGFRKLVSLMKNMDLKSTETEFKIDDTNSQIHFTALIDDQPQSFPAGDFVQFQIKNNNGYIQPAKGVVDGSQVILNSEDLKGLPVGTYQIELWHIDKNGKRDIFPANGFKSFTINENALGTVGNTVSQVTLQQIESSIQEQLPSLISTAVADAVAKIPKPGTPKDGTNAPITIGPTEQLPAGSQPNVKNIGTNLNAQLVFGIPASTIKTTQITTDNADLNDFNDDGRYAGNAMRIQNCPSTGYFLLDVADGGEFKTQFYTDVQNNYRYMRSYFNGSWSAWSWIGFWN